MKTDMELRQAKDQHRRAMKRINKQLRERKRKAHGLPKRKKGMGVRIGDRDEAEKVRRGYVEAGSYVRRDGSEKLVGRDWIGRKAELWQRAGHQCEYQDSRVGRCNHLGEDAHHLVRRSVRRDDRLRNLQLLCRAHHQELDPRKIRSGKVGA